MNTYHIQHIRETLERSVRLDEWVRIHSVIDGGIMRQVLSTS